MNIVAFDTSTESCSVAVKIGNEIRCDHRMVQREHAKLLLPMVQSLLAEFDVKPASLDGVVFGQGPGSFTGVRIAAAAAQGLAVAADCGVHGVSSLQAIARGAVRARIELGADAVNVAGVIAAIDARMDQVYVNAYSGDLAVSVLGEEAVVNPHEVTLPETLVAADRSSDQDVILCGSGCMRYEQQIRAQCEKFLGDAGIGFCFVPDIYPHAVDLLHLTNAENPATWNAPEHAQPVYLRNKVALTEAERLSC